MVKFYELLFLLTFLLGCSNPNIENKPQNKIFDHIGFFSSEQVLEIEKIQRSLANDKGIDLHIYVNAFFKEQEFFRPADKELNNLEKQKKDSNPVIYISLDPQRGRAIVSITPELSYSYYTALMSNRLRHLDSFINSKEAINNIIALTKIVSEDFEVLDSTSEIKNSSLNDLVEFKVDKIINRKKSSLDFLRADFGGGAYDTLITISGADTIRIIYLIHQIKYFRELIEKGRVKTYITGKVCSIDPFIVSLRSERFGSKNYYREPS